LWDEPLRISLCAHAGHPLFAAGLLTVVGGRDPLDWREPLEMPTAVVHALIDPDAPLPQGLVGSPPATTVSWPDDWLPTLAWLAANPPLGMQIVPLLGPTDGDFPELAAAAADRCGRPLARLVGDAVVDHAGLVALAAACWLRDADVLLPEG